MQKGGSPCWSEHSVGMMYPKDGTWPAERSRSSWSTGTWRRQTELAGEGGEVGRRRGADDVGEAVVLLHDREDVVVVRHGAGVLGPHGRCRQRRGRNQSGQQTQGQPSECTHVLAPPGR